MQAYLFFRLPVCLFSNILFDAVSVPLLSSLCLFSVMQPFIFVRPFVKISLSFYVVSFIFHSFSISFLAFTCHLLDLVLIVFTTPLQWRLEMHIILKHAK